MKMEYKGYRKKYNSLLKVGFIPEEAEELAKTSRRGFQAPYISALMRSRRRLRANADRYQWTDRQYTDYIRNKYKGLDNGIYYGHEKFADGEVNVWSMVREYERIVRDRGDAYESPWRKSALGKTRKKKITGRITRKQIIAQKLQQKRNKLAKTAKDYERQRLEDEIFELERMLSRYDN